MADNGGFSRLDIECGRSYPLILAAAATTALELQQVPGFATNPVGESARSSFDNAPFGTTWTMLTGSAGTLVVLPRGASFRKLTQATFATGGRATRIINPGFDNLVLGNVDDPFITSLAVTGGVNTVAVSGTLLQGNGAVAALGLIDVSAGAAAGGADLVTVGVAVGTLQYTAPGAAGAGCRAIVQATAAGAFTFTFTYAVGTATPALPVVVQYRGMTLATTAAMT